MFKVMIIDDEKALRSLLKITINWEELGLVVAGEAASGIEAINTIDAINPDIVFVDIKMPFMDGIEFSKLAMARYPKLIIIILTAFNDFEYARQCIGTGVCNYLLKPIVRTEIQEALLLMVKELKERKSTDCEEEVDGREFDNVTKIKEYLKENYQDESLNLTAVANLFGFNASYLSRMFKAETGSNLIDYLTKCRMEKAIQHAKQGALMYITAKQVGIPDPNYFGKCFKKFTNQTYSDYQKSSLHKNT